MSSVKECHIIGDSHVGYFLGKHHTGFIENINESLKIKLFVTKVGTTGSTARGLKNEDSNTQARKIIREYIKNNNIKNILLVIGDVDCNFVLEKKQEQEFDDLLFESVESYKNFLTEFVCPNIENVILMSPIPTSKSLANKNLKFMESRIKFTKAFQDLSDTLGVKYLNLFNTSLVDEDFFLKEEYQSKNADDIHMDYESPKNIVVSELIKLLI